MNRQLVMPVLLMLVAFLFLSAAATGAPPALVQDKLDHINANPTDTPGHFHVSPVFVSLTKVEIIKRDGPYGKKHTRVPGDQDWTFDKSTGIVELEVPVDNEQEMVIVYGKLAVPWAWHIHQALDPGSVKILLDDRTAVRGEDFEVDEETGHIQLLKKEDCRPDLKYYVTYCYKRDPKQPNVTTGGAIGNHDQRAIRRFLDLDEKESPRAKDNRKKTVGTNASPTDDPRRFTLVRPMVAEGMKVAIAVRGEPGNLDWLTTGEDYEYDENQGVITFKRDIPVDRETQYVFVSGVPAPKNIFHFRTELEPDSVEVHLNDRRLVEGEGFTVDYENGTVTVFDPGMLEEGAQYYFRAGNRSFGNYSPSRSRAADDGDEATVPANAIGTNALPTDHPRIYKLGSALRSKGIRIAIASRDKPGDLKWLKRGEDFAFSQDDKIITFLRDVPVDHETEYVFVMGSRAK